MKKKYVVGPIILIVSVAILSFYFLNNSAENFSSTIEQLGFDTPAEYQTIPANLVCQDANCNEMFPFGYFGENCNELWNSSEEGTSAVGKPRYYYTGIFNCENKKYVYYSESPPTKIKIAEIK